MTRYRYDKDMECIVEVRDGSNFFEEDKPKGPTIIKDIEGYKTVAGDIANNGERVYIGSRSEHKAFLRRNNLIEVGNDYDKGQVDHNKPRKATNTITRQERVERIKLVADLIKTGRVRERFNV